MSTSRFALFVDLENCGAKVATLNNILEKVKIRGDILLGKVYGYTDKYSDLKEVLLSNTFTVVPSLRYGISQKNNADILLVIDALEVASAIGAVIATVLPLRLAAICALSATPASDAASKTVVAFSTEYSTPLILIFIVFLLGK